MKLIESKAELLEQYPDLEGVYKHIEIAGRTCYKSEANIAEDSAKKFVDRLIKSGHRAMLEHGTVYMQMLGVFLNPEDGDIAYGNYFINHYILNPYSKVTIIHDDEWKANVYVTTNYRVLVENNWLEDLKFQCEPTEYHEKRITIKFTCDRGVSHEFVRHRVFSFAQESTRYCNYSKDKFNNELTFIKPAWFDNERAKDDESLECRFIDSIDSSSIDYFSLLQLGLNPQEARAVLPNATKTELVMTGFESDWKGFFKLRCSTSAHPDARKLAEEAKQLIEKV